MRTLTVLFISILFVPFVNGQELNDVKAISLNTKFVLELTKNESNNYTYEIISEEPFADELEMDSAFTFLDKKLGSNRIQGIFSTGTFGSERSILLVIKSELDKPLQYELMIDVKGRGRYLKTSTNPLSPGIPSIEIWPYYIHSIKIASFKELEIKPITIPEPKIDSTCFLNPELTVENGELLFRQHFQRVKNGLTEESFFKLESMLTFEDSIHSENISLGHYYALSEGIYPYFKNHTFGNPLRYRRIECPYFEGHSSYFYTKNEKNLKVAGYEWREFKLSDWPIEETDRSELRNLFEQKYESIKEIIIEFLGHPIPLDGEVNPHRIDTKWETDDGIKAYLFMFGSSNEIRFFVYRD